MRNNFVDKGKEANLSARFLANIRCVLPSVTKINNLFISRFLARRKKHYEPGDN